MQEALLKDLNTPEALGRLFKIIRELSEAFERDEFNGKEDEMNRIRNGFRTTMDAFGLQLKVKDEEPVEIPVETKFGGARWEAKIAKDWGLADQPLGIIRLGWLVKDGKDSFELAKV